MKKFFSFALVALMVGMMFCSCKDDAKKSEDKNQSKAEQVIALFKDLAQKMEALPADKYMEEGQKLGQEFEAKFKELGLDKVKEPTKEGFKAAGIDMTDEQIKEIESIVAKLQEISMKKMQEAMGSAADKIEEPAEAPEPVEAEMAE